MMENLIERVDGFIQYLDRINHISDKELENICVRQRAGNSFRRGCI